MRNIIFIAPPAAGKGTLSEYLVEKFNYKHISTGNLLRKKAREDTEDGKKMATFLKTGQFVDDEYIIKLLCDEIKTLEATDTIILDGIPRNLFQAEYLEKYLSNMNFIVIHITTDKNALEQRVTGRYICPDCNRTYNKFFEDLKPTKNGICDECNVALFQRNDDNANSFKIRYENYLRDTLPVLDYYRIRGKLYELDNSSSDLGSTYKRLVNIVRDKND